MTFRVGETRWLSQSPQRRAGFKREQSVRDQAGGVRGRAKGRCKPGAVVLPCCGEEGRCYEIVVRPSDLKSSSKDMAGRGPFRGRSLLI